MRRHSYRRKHRRGGRGNNRTLLKLAAVLILCLAAIITLDSKMRPVIQSVAQTQARNMATRLVNDAINEVIELENVSYQSLVTIEKSNDNNVTSVQADAMRMNRLKASIGNQIADKLSGVKNNRMRIPLGSFLSSEILSGRGPDVSIYVSLSGSVITNINSNFSSAGINQTLHSIMLGVEIEIFVLIPGFNTTTKVKTEVCLAQTVIVGMTPDAYANIVGSLDGLTAKK